MNKTEVESRVSAVTVYRGRALITRETKLTLKPGEHSLIFTELPANLDRNSLQVKGTGEAVIGGCSFETQFLTTDVHKQASALKKRLEELSDEMAVLEMRAARLEGESGFVERIAGFVTTPRETEVRPLEGTASKPECMNVSLWKDMTGFYRERLTAINAEKLEIIRKKREAEREIRKTTEELNALGRGTSRSREVIKVALSKRTRGELLLNLSYVVRGPTWKPVYNLRAEADSRKLSLEYDALVSQTTGEDWQDIELRLSTARIGLTGAIPELKPWRIGYPLPQVPRALRAHAKSKRAAKPASEEMDMASSGFSEGEVPLAEPSPVAFNEAEVEQAGTGVVFKVAGGSGVTGDNRESRVVLSREELQAEYSYHSVPKLVEFAYRTARFTNSTDFAVLPGPVNVFYDGSLVSNSVLELIMPGQEATVSLGVDEGIKVEYRFLKKFRKSEGMINKRSSMQYEYRIILENNTGREAGIKVLDQLPVSQEKEIEVKCVEPDAREKTVTIDDESTITWELRLSKGEKRELPLTYIVEHPLDTIVAGL